MSDEAIARWQRGTAHNGQVRRPTAFGQRGKQHRHIWHSEVADTKELFLSCGHRTAGLKRPAVSSGL